MKISKNDEFSVPKTYQLAISDYETLKKSIKIVILNGVVGIMTLLQKLILANIFGPFFRQFNLREFLELLNWRNVLLVNAFPYQAYCIVYSI